MKPKILFQIIVCMAAALWLAACAPGAAPDTANLPPSKNLESPDEPTGCYPPTEIEGIPVYDHHPLLWWFTEPPTSSPIPPFDRESFDRERAAWERQGIHSYSVELGMFSYKPEHMRVRVEGDVVTSVEDLFEGGGPILPPPQYLAISNIYDWILSTYEEILSPPNKQVAELYRGGDNVTFVVLYNAQYHYPEYVQFSIRDEDFDGGWTTTRVTKFQPLQ